MLIRSENRVVSATIGDEVTFGRAAPADLLLGEDDRAVSRRAGRIVFRNDAWVATNTGTRPFWLIDANGETELDPQSVRFEHRLIHNFAWLRYPGTQVDYALTISVPDEERPSSYNPIAAGGTDATIDRAQVTFTDNELRSVHQIYRSYLRLPPHYDRRPSSFRAVASALGVEENKVKADHRRVVEKVAAAGGPANGTTNREGLVAWLLNHGHLTFDAADTEITEAP